MLHCAEQRQSTQTATAISLQVIDRQCVPNRDFQEQPNQHLTYVYMLFNVQLSGLITDISGALFPGEGLFDGSFNKHLWAKTSSRAGSSDLVMCYAVFITLCRALWLRLVQLPYQAETHFLSDYLRGPIYT